ncbi:MAG: nucleoside monophosphate kinase [Patescibacteria group bacterium]
MKDFEFPIFKTKKTPYKKFLLEDPSQRQKYFKYKAGPEIKKIKNYLKKNTFVAFLMGKKNSGKGTHSKMFMEAIGADNIAHIAVGDIVRSVHRDLENPKKKKELISFLKQRYRGFMPLEKAMDVILGRDLITLLPTEIILALVEHEIGKLKGKAVFIDGFPRNLDQISYSLYFRALMGYRDDPDFFIFIDVPDSVIDERIKNRVVCPVCNAPRSLKLMRTQEIGYDKIKKEFYLKCDNSSCKSKGSRMIAKASDALGMAPLKERIALDEKIARSLIDLQGVPKVFLRNGIPAKDAKNIADDYELTPAYSYELDKKGGIKVIEKPWVIKGEKGIPSHSLLPPAIAISLIKQLTKVLEL